jgi:hypothetical protein
MTKHRPFLSTSRYRHPGDVIRLIARALVLLAGSNALVLLLDTQHYGYLIAQIFFGLWLVPLGYLAYKSGSFPRALGVLLVVAGGCYLVGCSRRSWSPAPARTSTPTSPTYQQSRKSGWSSTCS